VAEFKYLEMTVANQNYGNEETDSRLHVANGCCDSVQKFCSLLLSKKPELKCKKKIQFYLFCVGYLS
jgi:hypothetical protein